MKTLTPGERLSKTANVWPWSHKYLAIFSECPCLPTKEENNHLILMKIIHCSACRYCFWYCFKNNFVCDCGMGPDFAHLFLWISGSVSTCAEAEEDCLFYHTLSYLLDVGSVTNLGQAWHSASPTNLLRLCFMSLLSQVWLQWSAVAGVSFSLIMQLISSK